MDKYRFEKLTPVSNIDISIYESAIDFAFEDPDIKNIAISGSYGAGKSSIFETYKKKHADKHYIHISLAHFNDIKTGGSQKDIGTSVLEGKILNQLIHQIPPQNIPQTMFKMKGFTKNGDTWKYAVFATFLPLIVLQIIFFDKWVDFVATLPKLLSCLLAFTTKTWSLLFGGILALAIILCIIYKVFWAQRNKNIFRKISFHGNEIEILHDNESYFDKYLNEVLYLFLMSNADAIVFEDIDRFNSMQIFERLREINTLVNSRICDHGDANISNQKTGIANSKTLRFFYLLRDDIFISKDRTKFFDYIIPIVPVIDSSNSYDSFLEHFSKNGLKEKFDEAFLQGLSLYVDDMRLLKNICNEFFIYYNRLNTTELDNNKMLAVITYKNLFPKDFSDLQINQGFVYALFNNKPKFIIAEEKELKGKLLEIQNHIQQISNEHLEQEEELDIIYKQKQDAVNNTPISRNRSNLQEEFNEWKDKYAIRKERIAEKSNGKLVELQNEAQELNKRISKLESQRLKSLITRENIESIFSIVTKNAIGDEEKYEDVKSNNYFSLLKYLIRNGYIDETYPDYMTYFYENSLSQGDKMFLRSITDRKGKSFTYQLKSPKKVLSRLNALDFEQIEVLNFNLCDYLIKESQNDDYISILISQLKRRKNYDFVEQWVNNTTCISTLVCTLNAHWPSLYAELSLVEKDEFARRFSVWTLYYSTDEQIKVVDEKCNLGHSISNYEDILNIESPQIDKLLSGFELLKVSFKRLCYPIANKELFLQVYEKNLYDLTFDNIKLILQNVYKCIDADEISHKNYSLIAQRKDSALCNRINSNFAEYLQCIFENCSNSISDSEEDAIAILNRSDIGEEDKEKYIANLKTSIENLQDVSDSGIWECLLLNGNLAYTEENILCYFDHRKRMDSSLVKFINSRKHNLNFKKSSVCQSEIRRPFFKEIITCNELYDKKYGQIVATLGYYYPGSSFSIPDIDDRKIAILVKNKIVQMGAENLEFIRENYPNIRYSYIRRNINSYVEIMTNTLLQEDELLEVISWDIPDSLKIKLLELTDMEITVIGKNYAPQTRAYILNHNLYEDDKYQLYRTYDAECTEIKEIIFSYAVNDINWITENPDSVSGKLKVDLLCTDSVPRKKRIDLFLKMFSLLSDMERYDYLDKLGQPDYRKISDSRSRPKFVANEENEVILTAFVAHKIIYDFLPDSDRAGYFKIRRNPPRK